MILAEVSGNVVARFVVGLRQNRNFNGLDRIKVRGFFGFFALCVGLLLLSFSWDRIECFPLSFVNVGKFSLMPSGNCVRVWPMLLPFLSGFIGCYERVSVNWGNLRELGRKRVQLLTLFYTTVLLFIPAVVSMVVFEAEGDSISISNLGWPLANTVIFGVLLSENITDERLASFKDFRKEFFVTLACTLVLELFYYPELSLWGLLICGLLVGISVRELDSVYLNNLDLGLDSDSLTTSIMKPIRHIFSERKSRKIALFLLINTAYMVVEFVVGFMSNSLGLISDACHMLFDCAALAIGLYASYISRLPANVQYNYGRGRFEVLSGYVNAVFLVLVGALILLESLERILEPQEISTSSLLTVSIGGLLVNMVGLIFFHDEHHHAHGGSGSCSHSHSHHDHSLQDNVGHGHQVKIKHHRDHVHNHEHSHHDHDHHHHSCDHAGHGQEVHITHPRNHVHHDGKCDLQHHNHDHGHDHHHPSRDQSNQIHYDGKGENIHAHHNHGHDHEHHNHDHSHDHHNHDHSNGYHNHDHSDFHNHRDHSHDHHDLKDNRHHMNHHDHFHYLDHRHHPDNHSHETQIRHEQEEQQSHGGNDLKHKHHHHIDHNMKGIFLHVLADTLGSVGVVISTLLIQYKGWFVADPACSIFISVLIVASVIPLLRNSAEILLQRVPRAHEVELKEAVVDIMKIKGVSNIQNFHVWSLTNTDVVGTLHLHVSGEAEKVSTRSLASEILQDAGIKDLTVQVEYVQSR